MRNGAEWSASSARRGARRAQVRVAQVHEFQHRGLRQGDPLSPYLFLIVAEGFSCLIQRAEELGELKGIRVCRGAPMVSHLLFADDSLILMNADKKNADCLRNLLDRYCQSSGQMLSVNKSSIFFSLRIQTRGGDWRLLLL